MLKGCYGCVKEAVYKMCFISYGEREEKKQIKDLEESFIM